MLSTPKTPDTDSFRIYRYLFTAKSTKEAVQVTGELCRVDGWIKILDVDPEELPDEEKKYVGDHTFFFSSSRDPSNLKAIIERLLGSLSIDGTENPPILIEL